jgi:hypothetical protein
MATLTDATPIIEPSARPSGTVPRSVLGSMAGRAYWSFNWRNSLIDMTARSQRRDGRPWWPATPSEPRVGQSSCASPSRRYLPLIAIVPHLQWTIVSTVVVAVPSGRGGVLTLTGDSPRQTNHVSAPARVGTTGYRARGTRSMIADYVARYGTPLSLARVVGAMRQAPEDSPLARVLRCTTRPDLLHVVRAARTKVSEQDC